MTIGRALLDVNVLLAWPNHLHHDTARAWFRRNAHQGWSTTPITESGFVRISSNPKVFDDAVAPRDAVQMLIALRNKGAHQFWEDATEFSQISPEWLIGLAGYRQVTDLHLLHLASSRKGRLVSFDSRLRALVPSDIGDSLLELL